MTGRFVLSLIYLIRLLYFFYLTTDTPHQFA